MRILIDMDETVARLHDYCIERWNRENPKQPITKQYLDSWEAGAIFNHFFKEYDTYRTLQVFPDSQEVIQKWKEEGHHILFVTASPNIEHCHRAKKEWIDEHFADLGSNRVIFTAEKWRIPAEVLIDDSPKFLEPFRGVRVKPDRLYNKETPAEITFHAWKEIQDIHELAKPHLNHRRGFHAHQNHDRRFR